MAASKLQFDDAVLLLFASTVQAKHVGCSVCPLTVVAAGAATLLLEFCSQLLDWAMCTCRVLLSSSSSSNNSNSACQTAYIEAEGTEDVAGAVGMCIKAEASEGAVWAGVLTTCSLLHPLMQPRIATTLLPSVAMNLHVMLQGPSECQVMELAAIKGCILAVEI